jgi:signal transduction histidine kinase
VASGTEQLGTARRELARLQALARVAGAAAHGGGLDAVLMAIVEGVQDAFGLDVVLNLYDPDLDAYVVRVAVGEGVDTLMNTSSNREAFEELLDPVHEVVQDVFFMPQVSAADIDRLGAVYTPTHAWRGPGYWHPEDMCFVGMRTSRGQLVGILSIDSSIDQRIPDLENFELLRVFAMVGANAIENALLTREIAGLEAEREMKQLRHELEDEVALRTSLLEIGSRLGAASAGASKEIFRLLAERLSMVVPIKSLTVSTVDNETQTVRPIYHSEEGVVADAVLQFEIPFGLGVTGAAVVRRQTVIDNDEEGQASIAVDIPNTPEVGEHVLAVPVTVEEQVKVALTLRRNADEPPFVQDDAHRAGLFAQHLASAFLLMELEESRQQLADQVVKLEDLNRLKDEFVAGVSHELRTPITAIIGSVVTVARLGDMLSAEDRSELLTGAERQAKQLAELLENLLAESRLTRADPVLSLVQVDIGPFVEQVAETLRFRGPGREIETDVDAAVVETDRTLLYRILFNLGDNALKYSEGTVVLRSRSIGGGVRIEVADDGIGIESEDIPKVFEQFHQLDASDTRGVGGVGLGLHLCLQAAQMLGGRITVESEPGEGSTFAVWLPTRPPASA